MSTGKHEGAIGNCNLCGGSCAVQFMAADDGWDDYGTTVKASGGYASPCLTDGMTYEFRLCESCVDGLMQRMAIPPRVGSYMWPGDKAFIQREGERLAAFKVDD